VFDNGEEAEVEVQTLNNHSARTENKGDIEANILEQKGHTFVNHNAARLKVQENANLDFNTMDNAGTLIFEGTL
jgi:hypothetical protein